MANTNSDKSTINSKLSEMLEKVKKYNVTPYEVGKNTPLTSTGVQKIFDRESKKPSINSINIINDYLIKTYEPEQFVQEQRDAYNLNEEATLSKILSSLERIEAKINAQNLKQEIMFEIIKNAKAKELEHLDKEFKAKIKR